MRPRIDLEAEASLSTPLGRVDFLAEMYFTKGKGLDTCYSATYTSSFTISEVAADWHDPMVPQRIM